MMQKGILLRAVNHAISETPVPRPPADHNAIDTAAYASLMKARWVWERVCGYSGHGMWLRAKRWMSGGQFPRQ